MGRCIIRACVKRGRAGPCPCAFSEGLRRCSRVQAIAFLRRSTSPVVLRTKGCIDPVDLSLQRSSRAEEATYCGVAGALPGVFLASTLRSSQRPANTMETERRHIYSRTTSSACNAPRVVEYTHDMTALHVHGTTALTVTFFCDARISRGGNNGSLELCHWRASLAFCHWRAALVPSP